MLNEFGPVTPGILELPVPIRLSPESAVPLDVYSSYVPVASDSLFEPWGQCIQTLNGPGDVNSVGRPTVVTTERDKYGRINYWTSWLNPAFPQKLELSLKELFRKFDYPADTFITQLHSHRLAVTPHEATFISPQTGYVMKLSSDRGVFIQGEEIDARSCPPDTWHSTEGGVSFRVRNFDADQITVEAGLLQFDFTSEGVLVASVLLTGTCTVFDPNNDSSFKAAERYIKRDAGVRHSAPLFDLFRPQLSVIPILD